MKLKTKIIITSLVVLVIVWSAGIIRFVQPLTRATNLRVIYYADSGEFKDNADAYEKLFNGGFYYLYLPNARPAYRWWAVDFSSMAIYSADAPRRLFSVPYVFRDHAPGIRLDDKVKLGEWDWQLTPDSASFSGSGFSCSVLIPGY